MDTHFGERLMAWFLIGGAVYLMYSAYKGVPPWTTFITKARAAGTGKSGGNNNGVATGKAIDVLLVNPVDGTPNPVIAPPSGANWTDDLYDVR